ncbi:MAG: hypothetical protein AAFZ99_09995 [Pseudomonadota bacterium]
MSTLHTLPQTDANHPIVTQAAGEVVALPFVHLETVLKTMRMLREFPDQSVLDVYNRSPQES